MVVTEGIHDSFVKSVTERISSLVVDDALKPGTQIGPAVDQRQLDQNLKYVAIGQEEGAKRGVRRRPAQPRHCRASTCRRAC